MKKIETFCPVRDVLSHFSDKWSTLVLWELHGNQVMRFSELTRSIPDISQKMLTVTLRALEADALVTRTVFPEIPPRVEYRLTDAGRSFIPHLQGLIDWALEHRTACSESGENGCLK